MGILGNLRLVLPSPALPIVLVLTSVVSGALLGAERQRRHKSAGFRTLALISLGSTLFTLAGSSGWFGPGESGRIASNIVTGVGFLGAGAILRDRGEVTGLTTAATIWVTAAIGLVVGLGYAAGGIGLALLVLLVLEGLARVEPLIVGNGMTPPAHGGAPPADEDAGPQVLGGGARPAQPRDQNR